LAVHEDLDGFATKAMQFAQPFHEACCIANEPIAFNMSLG
jgi:hypothetical protein